MASIDFSKFTFTAEQIRSVKELVFDEVIKSPEIAQIHTIYPNIVFDKEVGFIGNGGLVGVAYQGCEPTAQGYTIGTRKITWEPKAWEVYIEECRDTLENTAAVYSLHNGVKANDFSDTDYVAIVAQVLINSIKEFLVRVIWFGDKDAANVSAGGEIKDGIDVKYFSLLDGLFKQMDAQTTENAAQHVDFSGVTKANVQDKLAALVYGADVTLRQKTDAYILVSQSVADLYEQSLAGAALETMYRNLVDGQKVLTYNGIQVIAMPLWDSIIAAYLPNHSKNIAVYSHKDVLAVGVDSENSFSEIETNYDVKSRKVLISAGGKLDAKIAAPKLFVLGD
jgi:hypothetical protein